MIDYKTWVPSELFCGDLIAEALEEQRELIEQLVQCEEEDGEELNPDSLEEQFYGMGGLFGGDLKVLNRNLDNLIRASHLLLERYCSAFSESGLGRILVANTGSDVIDLGVQVRILQIFTNLSSKEDTPEYAEALMEEGLSDSILFHLKRRISGETVFWSIRCLTNFAALSLAIRDRIISEVQVDLLCFLAQSRELDPGSHDELLGLFMELSCDLDDDQAESMIEAICIFFNDFLVSKTKKMLEIANIMAQYRTFFDRFSDSGSIARMKSMFWSTSYEMVLSLLLGVFMKCVEHEPSEYILMVERILTLMSPCSQRLTSASCAFISKLFSVASGLISEEQAHIIIERLMICGAGARIALQADIARSVLWIVHEMSPGERYLFGIDRLVDYLDIDDTDIQIKTVEMLFDIFDNERNLGAGQYRDKFIELNGLSDLSQISAETEDDQLMTSIEHLVSTFFQAGT